MAEFPALHCDLPGAGGEADSAGGCRKITSRANISACAARAPTEVNPLAIHPGRGLAVD